MGKVRTAEIEEEPVGIVISSGSRAEKAPRLIAYVWGAGAGLKTKSLRTKGWWRHNSRRPEAGRTRGELRRVALPTRCLSGFIFSPASGVG